MPVAGAVSRTTSCQDADVQADTMVTVNLAGNERDVLRLGLGEWGGPASPTDALAVAMGFRDLSDFDAERRRLRRTLLDEQPLSTQDWRRVLVATEIVFISDVYGAGSDWSITTGLTDEETIVILRRCQAKIGRAIRQALGLD